MSAISSFRPLSSQEIEESDRPTGHNQGTLSRALLYVTPAHRQLARRQFLVQQIAYWMTVLGLFITEAKAPILSAYMVWVWLAVSVAAWALRLALFLPMAQQPAEVVKKSPLLQSIPLLIVLIACGYWIWTISLFSGPELTVRELFMCVGLLSISVSMTGMWLVTPIAVIIYNVALWGAFSFSLYTHDLASLPVIAVFDIGVFVVLWVNTFIAIHQLRDQLERGRQMSQLVTELESANHELEKLKNAAYKTLETRSEFFAEANHDFQQRLQSMKTWFLSAMAATKVNQPADAALSKLGDEVDALQTYISNVVDFARIESLDAGVRVRATDIQSLFRKLDLRFAKTAQENGVRLHFRMARVTVGTDASMLLRILENLIANALKYTRSNVLVCARRSSRGVAIEVWDQGPGIKAEAHQRIFDAFHQEEVDDERTRAKGAGLGLAIVRRFALRLNYRVQVKSVVGKGTRFRVLIPSEFVIGNGAGEQA